MEEFLAARRVDILRDEKIDDDCVKIMTDEELTKFIPVYGDILALKQFFHKENDKQKIKKQSIFETLRIKLKFVSDQNQKKSFQALKPEKTVGMGIMIYDEDEQRFHTVRTKNGGGNLSVSSP
ncbi:hypothetical protein LOTGIDRAFT_157134 [Lottia gigantea]|uniref:Uncharacterized protein n=1 Tax=Lottia gigantea TaxID=225164 RepID=V4B8D8_LOTGI|nr:hypothetical protein LOTGIDRAFT_157134 [Lottia gigantea]ESP01997.1 hypothetical protein LOTGIDRAFT_157134 [Lottia gigantea]